MTHTKDDATQKGCVLCGIADAESGVKVARVAGSLSTRLGVRLVLVHVAEIAPQALSAVPTDSERVQQENLQAGTELLGAVAQASHFEDAQQHVEWGPAAGALLEVADREDALLVVIGTRGLGGLKSALLGSVSHQVAAEAPCPVVVVAPQARELPA